MIQIKECDFEKLIFTIREIESIGRKVISITVNKFIQDRNYLLALRYIIIHDDK